MAKTNLCCVLAMVFGLGTIAFMVSTIVVGIRLRDERDEVTALEAKNKELEAITMNPTLAPVANICEGTKPKVGFPNVPCKTGADISKDVPPQAAANVTEGYVGDYDDTDAPVPITVPFEDVVGLCPVNVHWHLGAEHASAGEYGPDGSGPTKVDPRRKLAGKTTQGGQCSLYDETIPMFTTEFKWQFCEKMEVGQTYEVHWPHSVHGDCGTKYQYQTPFYDGVFCHYGANSVNKFFTEQKLSLPEQIGVQAQVFVIVNDDTDKYDQDNLFHGMITNTTEITGDNLAIYTGSTTGDSRNNTVCSKYGPITWQVDRTCNLISARSFDKMCEMMKDQADDLSGDLYPHGSRPLVDDFIAIPQYKPTTTEVTVSDTSV